MANNSIRSITITEANLKNGSLHLGSAIDMFSKAVLGGSNAETAGRNVTVYLTGLNTTISTDIAGDKKIFRRRFWNSFFKHHGLRAGDSVSLWKVTESKFVASPLKRVATKGTKKAVAAK